MASNWKVPVKELQGKSVCEQTVEFLRNDPKNGYNVGAIMIEGFGIPKNDIDGKPFKDWKKGQPTLYSRIRSCLEKLVKEEKINKKRKGKADYYWLRN